MSEFFAMGGYGAFVWPCFAAVAVVMAALAVTTIRQLRASRATLASIEAQMDAPADET